MLTIKELADKLGVSKQTITNNKPSDMEFTKIKNAYHIDGRSFKKSSQNAF